MSQVIAACKPARWIVWLAVAAALLLPAATAHADVGPKPTMSFKLVYQIAPVTIVGGQQIECQDSACTDSHPLQQRGPQRFECQSDSCFSLAYGYAPYHKLLIQFADRTRESNVFQMSGFSGEFTVTVREQDLLVKQTYTPASILDPTRVLLYFPLALFITLVVESAVALIYLSMRKLPLRILLWVLVANVVSLPVVWFVIPLFGLEPLPTTILSEIFAVVFEALLIFLLSRKRISFGATVILSLLMNAASFILGLCASSVLGLG